MTCNLGVKGPVSHHWWPAHGLLSVSTRLSIKHGWRHYPVCVSSLLVWTHSGYKQRKKGLPVSGDALCALASSCTGWEDSCQGTGGTVHFPSKRSCSAVPLQCARADALPCVPPPFPRPLYRQKPGLGRCLCLSRSWWELLLAAGEQRGPAGRVAAASACWCACKGTALSVPGLKPPKSTFFFLSICHFSTLCLRACAQ